MFIDSCGINIYLYLPHIIIVGVIKLQQKCRRSWMYNIVMAGTICRSKMVPWSRRILFDWCARHTLAKWHTGHNSLVFIDINGYLAAWFIRFISQQKKNAPNTHRYNGINWPLVFVCVFARETPLNICDREFIRSGLMPSSRSVFNWWAFELFEFWVELMLSPLWAKWLKIG